MIRADCSAISVPRFSRPDYYTTSLSVCQEVFEKFFNFFAVFFALNSPPLLRSLVDSLHIIALLFLFVKRFFESFFGLESSAVCHKNVVVKLYIMHKSSRVQSRKAPLPEEKGLQTDIEIRSEESRSRSRGRGWRTWRYRPEWPGCR